MREFEIGDIVSIPTICAKGEVHRIDKKTMYDYKGYQFIIHILVIRTIFDNFISINSMSAYFVENKSEAHRIKLYLSGNNLT